MGGATLRNYEASTVDRPSMTGQRLCVCLKQLRRNCVHGSCVLFSTRHDGAVKNVEPDGYPRVLLL